MKKQTLLFLFSILFTPLFSQKINVSTGTIKRFSNFKSKYVAPRHVDVWLPKGYNTQQKYAVLYMNDGQMLFDTNQNTEHKEWKVDETLGALMKTGKIKKGIVVAVWNTDKRAAEFLPQKPFLKMSKKTQEALKTQHKSEVISDNYLKFLVEEVKPFIDKTFSVNTDKQHTFIAGSSMGGLISLYALCEYPSVFGGAACLSTHWLGATLENNIEFREVYKTYLDIKLPALKTSKIYFDYGTVALDALYEPHQKVIDALMISKGFTVKNWITKKFEGADHSEKSWAKRLDIPIVFLLGK
jgi:predicted alpha/beta superfamily hydrolase